MELEEIKKKIRENVKFRTGPLERLGGQHVGIMSHDVTLTSEELDFSVTIGYCRSQLKNKELAMTLFELTLDELIK